MSNRILIIAHAPLATALRDCAMHVYAECAATVLALDVQPQAQPEDTLREAQALVGDQAHEGLLVLTDIFGATPANVAQKLVSGDALVARALTGGTQGVMQVSIAAPQHQTRPTHDSTPNNHHQ